MPLKLTGAVAAAAVLLFVDHAFADKRPADGTTDGGHVAAHFAELWTLPEPMSAISGRIAASVTEIRQDATARLEYSEEWLAALPEASGDAEWQCLATALYFEARGETVKGQVAVAEVILNRSESPLYPDGVCRVVNQGGGGGCQFSFTCDSASDRIREKGAYLQAGKIARLMLDGAPRSLTAGATHFHTRQVRPGWSRKFARTAAIGAHIFYRQSGA
jgi:spore germination cell wall hydrolase CwlJ-like protein